MSAAIARYLLEFDAPGRPEADAPEGDRRGPAASVKGVDPVEAAFANGFAKAAEQAEARRVAELAEQKVRHEKELAAVREAWAQEEGTRLAEQLAGGLKEMETRLADSVARVLKPFVGAALRRQAMADLVQSLKVLLARDGAAAVSVCGPPDLLEVLQARLEGSIADVTYHPDEGCDLRVTVGNTLLETRLGAWIAKIGEAAA